MNGVDGNGDLVASDDAVDKLILKADTGDYSNTDDDTLSHTVVNGFNVAQDKFNVKYGSDDALGASSSYLDTSETESQTVALSADRSVVERTSRAGFGAGFEAFDTVSEIQTLIADSITTVPDAADKVLNIFYGFNTTSGNAEGIVVASSMGDTTSANLLEGDDFSVMSLARIVGLTQGSFAEENLKPADSKKLRQLDHLNSFISMFIPNMKQMKIKVLIYLLINCLHFWMN